MPGNMTRSINNMVTIYSSAFDTISVGSNGIVILKGSKLRH